MKAEEIIQKNPEVLEDKENYPKLDENATNNLKKDE